MSLLHTQAWCTNWQTLQHTAMAEYSTSWLSCKHRNLRQMTAESCKSEGLQAVFAESRSQFQNTRPRWSHIGWPSMAETQWQRRRLTGWGLKCGIPMASVHLCQAHHLQGERDWGQNLQKSLSMCVCVCFVYSCMYPSMKILISTIKVAKSTRQTSLRPNNPK